MTPASTPNVMMNKVSDDRGTQVAKWLEPPMMTMMMIKVMVTMMISMSRMMMMTWGHSGESCSTRPSPRHSNTVQLFKTQATSTKLCSVFLDALGPATLFSNTNNVPGCTWARSLSHMTGTWSTDPCRSPRTRCLFPGKTTTITTTYAPPVLQTRHRHPWSCRCQCSTIRQASLPHHGGVASTQCGASSTETSGITMPCSTVRQERHRRPWSCRYRSSTRHCRHGTPQHPQRLSSPSTTPCSQTSSTKSPTRNRKDGRILVNEVFYRSDVDQHARHVVAGTCSWTSDHLRSPCRWGSPSAWNSEKPSRRCKLRKHHPCRRAHRPQLLVDAHEYLAIFVNQSHAADAAQIVNEGIKSDELRAGGTALLGACCSKLTSGAAWSTALLGAWCSRLSSAAAVCSHSLPSAHGQSHSLGRCSSLSPNDNGVLHPSTTTWSLWGLGADVVVMMMIKWWWWWWRQRHGGKVLDLRRDCCSRLLQICAIPITLSLSLSLSTGAKTFDTNQKKWARELRHSMESASASAMSTRAETFNDFAPKHRF